MRDKCICVRLDITETSRDLSQSLVGAADVQSQVSHLVAFSD